MVTVLMCVAAQPVFVVERLMVSGLVMMLFKVELAVRRVTFSMTLTVTYMAMLLIFHPYASGDLNFLAAIGSQFALLFSMLISLYIRIFDDINLRVDLESAQQIMSFDGPSQVCPQKTHEWSSGVKTQRSRFTGSQSASRIP
jgi:hypothetical protein